MKDKGDDGNEELSKVEKDIAKEACGQIDDSIKGLDSENGGFNPGHMWKLKSKVIPKPVQVPTAMIDPESGKLVTADNELKKHTISYYKNVLRNREIYVKLVEQKKEKEELCKLRLQETKQIKTKDWTEDDILKALKDLKQKKSRDPNMYANEIFQPQVAGKDLIKAIQNLMNRIKNDSVYPKALTLCNITSIYKHKGSHNIFSSYRGIFRVQALRNILERLLYNDEYSNIDSNLTDANVGARQKRNIRDNIFVLNAVMNEAIQGSKEAVDITVYDVEKCFDALWVQECINDMYEAGLKNNKLNILFLMNQHAQVAIKTSSGNTERTSMSNLIMQDTVWGSLFCTVSMDKLPRLQYENKEMLYKYRGVVSVPSLEMVDVIVGIKKCGKDSVISNAVINSFIEHKKLTMGKAKCHQIHCGKKSSFCQELKVHNDKMHSSNEETYLGDQINAN